MKKLYAAKLPSGQIVAGTESGSPNGAWKRLQEKSGMDRVILSKTAGIRVELVKEIPPTPLDLGQYRRVTRPTPKRKREDFVIDCVLWGLAILCVLGMAINNY